MTHIQVLGIGCEKCRTLTANAEAAVREMGIEARIDKVEKVQEIMAFGIMTTPALVVDGAVKSAGRALRVDDIKKLLQQEDER